MYTLSLLTLLGAVTSVASASAAASNYSGPIYTYPSQLGPYPVSIWTYELHTSRVDPLSPTANSTHPEKRRLMLSILQGQTYQLSCPDVEYIPYMPDKTATVIYDSLNETLAMYGSNPFTTLNLHSIQLESCKRSANHTVDPATAPLVLFQGGYGGSRLMYQHVLTALASAGYTVVLIDTTYEAPIVEFDDGSVATPNLAPFAPYPSNFTLQVRADDYSSVLDAIAAGNVTGLQGYKSKNISAAVAGHSLGGHAAVVAAWKDKRFRGALNYDGEFDDYVLKNVTEIRQPVLLMGGIQGQSPQEQINSWNEVWQKHLRGWKAWVYPANTAHTAYTDLSIFLDVLRFRGTSPVITPIAGSINGARDLQLIWKHTAAFMEFVFKGCKPSILNQPSSEYPDMVFVKKTVQ